MFQHSIDFFWLAMGLIVSGLVLYLCLSTIYTSSDKKKKNIAVFCAVIAIISLSSLGYTHGWYRSRTQSVGTTEDFRTLNEDIVLRLDSRWQGKEYSIVQRLDKKNQIIDRRIIKDVPSEIQVGTIFILKDGKFFLHEGDIKKQ